MGAGTPFRIAGPVFRQIELPVDQRVTPAAGIGGENADLAILDPTGGPGILPGNAHGMDALLQKPGFIHDKNTIRIAKRIKGIAPNPITQTIRRPA